MDGSDQLTRRWGLVGAAGLVAVTALLVAACAPGIENGSPGHAAVGGSSPSTSAATDVLPVVESEPLVTRVVPPGSQVTIQVDTAVVIPPEPSGGVVVPPLYEATVATTMDLQDGIGMLDPGDAEVFDYRPDTPDDLLPTAYRSTVFGRGKYADPPQRPMELIVATPWPRAIRATLLCLVDGVQVPCSDEAPVWRVEIDDPALAFLALPEAEGRRDIMFAEERDGRPEGVVPVSRVGPVDGWDVPFSTLGAPPPVITNPLGGCNWVLFMDSLEPRDFFQPMRIRGPGPIYMVIAICPDHPSSYEMRPLIVVDETTVAHVDAFQPFIAEPGTTYAWKIPDELLNAGSTIRAAVVRRAPSGGVWVTHPLVPAADPG